MPICTGKHAHTPFYALSLSCTLRDDILEFCNANGSNLPLSGGAVWNKMRINLTHTLDLTYTTAIKLSIRDTFGVNMD